MNYKTIKEAIYSEDAMIYQGFGNYCYNLYYDSESDEFFWADQEKGWYYNNPSLDYIYSIDEGFIEWPEVCIDDLIEELECMIEKEEGH